MKVVDLDVETTGLDSKRHGIIQIAMNVWIDGVEIEKLNLLMCPFSTDEIDDETLELSGLTRQEIENRPAPAEMYVSLIQSLSKYVDKFDRSDKFVVIGYNAAFDTEFLRQWFRKNGDKFYGSWFWHPYVDVMTLAMAALAKERAQLVDFKLKTVARYFGIEVDDSKLHDAAYDVQLTRMIAERIEIRRKP